MSWLVCVAVGTLVDGHNGEVALHVDPMLASGAERLPVGDVWRYEVKWDGIRVLVTVDGSYVELSSRHGTDMTAAFPELGALGDVLPTGTVLDGELVVCDNDGRPDFRQVRRRMSMTNPIKIASSARTAHATFVIFDLVGFDGRGIIGLEWSRRRQLLEGTLEERGPFWLVNPVYEEGEALWEATSEQRLEGVVAKRVDSTYRGGRSTAWMKVKHRTRTALPVVDVRDDAVLVGDSETFRPMVWVDRFHPSVARDVLRQPVGRSRSGGPVGLCVVDHLATDSGGLREALVVGLRPLLCAEQDG